MPYCRRCGEPGALDKPLFRCVRCGRYYHSACHRPHPQESAKNWVCKRCLAKDQVRRGVYHESSSLSSRAASSSSSLSNRSDSLRTRMAPAADTSSSLLTNGSFSLIPSQRPPGPIITCSFPGCPAKIDGRQVLCEAHLQVLSKPEKTNGTHTAIAATGTSALPRQPVAAANPRKLLPETDKDRPIMRRKTASNLPLPQFVPQQPTPKHSTPSSAGDSTKSPSSPQRLESRPSAQSPPASPGPSPDGEPARKRQKLAPSGADSPKATGRVNGTGSSRPSTTEPGCRTKPAEPKSSHPSQNGANHSAQRQGKVRDKEGKTGNGGKPSSKHFIRAMPAQLATLRFIDPGPEDCSVGMFSEQSSSGMNESAGAVARRESEASDVTRKMGTSTSSLSRTGSIDSHTQTWRPPEVLTRQNEKPVPPDKARSETRTGYGPFQANGAASQKTHLSMRPAQITKTQPVKPLKTKEVDTARFDALIYSQPGAASPPPDVDLSLAKPPAAPKPTTTTPAKTDSDSPPPPQKHEDSQKDKEKDEPLYLPIDPRIHWPQPHSQAWHAAKQAEIQARGRRKDRFGRAAQSLRRQLREEEQHLAKVEFEETLPEKMAGNGAWVRALRRLRGLPVSSSSSSGSGSFGEREEDGGGASVNGVGRGVNGVNGSVNGEVNKRGRKASGGGGVVGKRVGNSGVVVVTGLSGALLGRRFGGDG